MRERAPSTHGEYTLAYGSPESENKLKKREKTVKGSTVSNNLGVTVWNESNASQSLTDE